jgi:hypothetical protein
MLVLGEARDYRGKRVAGQTNGACPACWADPFGGSASIVDKVFKAYNPRFLAEN